MPTLPFPLFVYRQLFKSIPKPTTSYAGKTVIITGSNAGIGKEAARHIVSLGASTVILAVRSLSKGEAAKNDIEHTTGTQGIVQVWQLDMSSYQSVLDFASRASKELDRLDVALLNAGVSRGEWEVFEQDESTLTVNVVSSFLLALALVPKLKETAARFETMPTLTIVGSETHHWVDFPEAKAPEGRILAEMNKKPEKMGAMTMGNRYQVSKLLQLFCVRAMVARKAVRELGITINYVNPGLCHSSLMRESGSIAAIFKFFLARTTECGSRNLVYAACAGPQTHGHYLSDAAMELPSDFALSDEGYKVQVRFWGEMIQKLEAIKPGVTEGFR